MQTTTRFWAASGVMAALISVLFVLTFTQPVFPWAFLVVTGVVALVVLFVLLRSLVSSEAATAKRPNLLHLLTHILFGQLLGLSAVTVYDSWVRGGLRTSMLGYALGCALLSVVIIVLYLRTRMQQP